MSSNLLITVPGGADGPSGVLVCSENFITWRHPDFPCIRVAVPKRPLTTASVDTPVLIVSAVVHRLKKGFFILVQNELGDVFKVTMDYSVANDGMMGGVDTLKIKYFDTVPVANSLILLKTGFLFICKRIKIFHEFILIRQSYQAFLRLECCRTFRFHEDFELRQQ